MMWKQQPLTNDQMKGLDFLRPWSITAAVLSLGVCTWNGVWSTLLKAYCEGTGRAAPWMVMLFDQSWCIPVGLLLAVMVVAKDLWCPAQISARVNAVTCLMAIGMWCLYTYIASQPVRFTMPWERKSAALTVQFESFMPNHSRQPRPSSALRKGEDAWLGLAAFNRYAPSTS